MRSIGPRGSPWTQGRAETITGCWAVVNEGLRVAAGAMREFASRLRTMADLRLGAPSVAHGAPIMLYEGIRNVRA